MTKSLKVLKLEANIDTIEIINIMNTQSYLLTIFKICDKFHTRGEMKNTIKIFDVSITDQHSGLVLSKILFIYKCTQKCLWNVISNISFRNFLGLINFEKLFDILWGPDKSCLIDKIQNTYSQILL